MTSKLRIILEELSTENNPDFLSFLFLGIGSGIIAIFSTLTGGGASLLLMPLVGFFIGAKSIAPVMTIGIAMSSGSRVFYFRKNIDWVLFRWLSVATVLGSILGSISFSLIRSEYLQFIIGIYLISTIFQFRKAKREKDKTPWKAWYFFPVGFVVAYLSGLIGGVGPLMNTAYIRYGISKEGLVGTRSANAVLLQITKTFSYAVLGFVNTEILIYGSVIGVFSVIGNYWGKKYLAGMSDDVFKNILVASMVVSGILILLKNDAMFLELYEFWNTYNH